MASNGVADVTRLDRAALADALASADVALIHAHAAEDPVDIARAVRARDPHVQIVMVVSAAQRRALERQIVLAPGLGEIVLADAEGVSAAIAAAREVTRQRRSFHALRPRVERALDDLRAAGRTYGFVSESYLATLLQLLPDPVITIDEGDRVISWSAAAARVTGVPRGDAAGRSLPSLFDVEDAEALRLLLEAGRDGVARGEIELRTAPRGACTFELTATPVDAGNGNVRLVLLHDVTEYRTAQRQLEEQAAELEMQSVELSTQTDELRDRSDELARIATARDQALSDLHRVVASRSRFYASMSHELRTPINAILGYTDLILAGVYGELHAQQAAGMQKVQNAARHLRELVNDVLDLSKIESGKLEIAWESVEPASLLDEVVATIMPMAEEHGCTLRVVAEPCPTPITTDARRLRQILLNLLSNAVKFGAGAPVEVHCGATATGVRFEVVDHGPGIAADELPRIFEEFVQLGSGGGGTGLGLPISRRLALLLGGSLEVVSEPGRGSTFTLTLPLGETER